MNAETLKKIEELNQRWANDPPDGDNEYDIASQVMDNLPDLIAAVKERDAEQKACEALVEALKLCQRHLPFVETDASLASKHALAQWEKDNQ